MEKNRESGDAVTRKGLIKQKRFLKIKQFGNYFWYAIMIKKI